MAIGCADMTDRASPLGIIQDGTCVYWSFLVSLRTKFNGLWDKLDACSLAEGRKYGEEGAHKQEIDDLPTVEGFFRVAVNHSGNPDDGYSCSAGEIVFILTGGTLRERIDDGLYNYMSDEYDWNAVMKDSCKNCSKFMPTSSASATELWTCGGALQNPYAGHKKLTFGTAETGCGTMFDWGSNRAFLQDKVNNFACWKKINGAVAGDCEDKYVSCCGEFYDIGRYETISSDGGVDTLVLKFIDVMVSSDGGSIMTGFLTQLIHLEHIKDIRSRVEADSELFSVPGAGVCVECGPDLMPGCPGSTGFKCTWPIAQGHPIVSYEKIASSGYVSSSCLSCEDLFVSLSFGSTICACDWEELAKVMDFLQNEACLPLCEPGCVCSSSSSICYRCADPAACNYDSINIQCASDPGMCIYCSIEQVCVFGACVGV